MSKRYISLIAGLALGLSVLRPTVAKAQANPTATVAGEVETRGDALPPGVLLDEEAARGLELRTGMALRIVYPEGIGLTKESEGWRSRLYNDAAHYCTIGYGHLIKKSPCDGMELPEFLAGITESKGEALLRDDMKQAEIAAQILVDAQLDDAQYAAVADFIYNVGIRNFQGSTLRRIINEGAFSQVPYQFNCWVRAGGKVWPGLQTRRLREIKMFFTNIGEPRGAEGAVPEKDQLDILPDLDLK